MVDFEIKSKMFYAAMTTDFLAHLYKNNVEYRSWMHFCFFEEKYQRTSRSYTSYIRYIKGAK